MLTKPRVSYAFRLRRFIYVKGYRKWLDAKYIEAYQTLRACEKARRALAGEEE